MTIMKKYLLMGALCTMAFAGCKNDVEPEVPTDADYTGLVLNEVCGNDGNAGEEDWVELYNTSGNGVDLNGVRLVKTDEDGVSEVLCTFAEGTTLAGRAFLVKVKGIDFTQGISNSKSVAITLQAPSGKEIDKFDRDAELGGSTGHLVGGSYSRIPDGTGVWTVVIEATKGTANKVTVPIVPPVANYTGLVLNELDGNKPKFIELYNGSGQEMDITGVKILKDGEAAVYVAPENTKIAAGGFLMLLADQADYSTGFTSGLSAKKSVKIELVAPDDTSIDVFENPSISLGKVWGENDPKYNGETDKMAYGRKENGTDWHLMKATQGTSNSTTAELGEKIEW